MSAGPDVEPGGNARLSALMHRATHLIAAGHRAQAILTLQDAICVAPANAPLHHDLGFLCLQEGRLSEAVAALRTALRLDPAFAQASLCLGIALQDQGDAPGAETAYRHALVLQPSLTVAHVCLGALLETRGATAQAIDVFRSGAARAPDTLWGRLAAARALVADDRDLEAEPALRELVTLHPANGMAHEMLATVLANTGRFEQAREGYERAIAAAPALAGCYYDLTRCRRITAADAPLVARMQAALQSAPLTPDARLKVHLALGKALDDLGDAAAAMRHFDAADTARRSLTRFDPHAFERRVEWLMTHFTADRLACARDAAHNRAATAGDSPIFIMGLPRSGTTLLEQILSGHPGVHAAGELAFWTQRGADWEMRLTGRAGLDRETRASADSHRAQQEIAALGTEYSDLVRTLAPQGTRLTDKMPLNVLWAGLIHLALPRATLLHCRRASVDTALSIHRTYFNPQLSFPTGGQELVVAIRAVEGLAAHWHAVLPANRFIEVDYEQLVQDPEPTVRRVTAGCGLPWDAACLRPDRNPRVIKTPSKWQARQPIHRDAVETWRRYAPWLGPLSVLVA